MLHKVLEADRYPSLLRQMPDPPAKLSVSGDLPQGDNYIAIVGAQKPTSKSRGIASDFAKKLSRAGIYIVGDLASEISQVALEAAGEKAIGISRGRRVGSFGKKIVKRGGVVVSELVPGNKNPSQASYLQKRLIAGISYAILIIEASERSQALITARLGAEYGRYVFVVSGEAGDRRYTGSHSLIRDGAILVQSVDEILEDLGIKPIGNKKEGLIEISHKGALLIQVLRIEEQPASFDRILELTKLEPHEVEIALRSLASKSIVEQKEEKYSINKP